MGAYTPVPHYGAGFEARIMDEVVRPTLAAMAARDAPFRGVMFVGLMVEGDRFNVLEFNVRFGDPECEPLMMRFDGDLAETLLAVAQARVREAPFDFRPEPRRVWCWPRAAIRASIGKGIPIAGLEHIDGTEPSEAKVRWAMEKTRVKVFHCGTAVHDGALVTDGGRVLAVTALADGLGSRGGGGLRSRLDDSISTGMHYRRDIGARALAGGPLS